MDSVYMLVIMDEGIAATLSAAPKFIIPKIHYLSFKIHHLPH